MSLALLGRKLNYNSFMRELKTYSDQVGTEAQCDILLNSAIEISLLNWTEVNWSELQRRFASGDVRFSCRQKNMRDI